MEKRRLHIPFKVEKLLSDLLVALTLPDLWYLQLETIKFILRLKVAKLFIAINFPRDIGYQQPIQHCPTDNCWEMAVSS